MNYQNRSEKESSSSGRILCSSISNMDLKIITNTNWPSFTNVALDIYKALKPYCNPMLFDLKEAERGGNILFIETIRKDTLKLLRDQFPGSNIVFYGTTEGHSFLDKESIEIARKIKVVAVSNFVKQMLEEVAVPVAGIVHHGLDMDSKEIDLSFFRLIEEKIRGKQIILTIANNDPRKGLDKLLRAYKLVEENISNSYLVLHTNSKRHYDQEQEYTGYNLQELASNLGIKRMWLTNNYGKMSLKEINTLYSLCNLYVLSSFTEGFGLPILEAYRFNRPVIAVNAPPFNEVIEDGQTGKLFPYKEIRWFNHKDKVLFKMHEYEHYALAEAIISLLPDINRQESMRAYIEGYKQLWSINKLYPKLLEYF